MTNEELNIRLINLCSNERDNDHIITNIENFLEFYKGRLDILYAKGLALSMNVSAENYKTVKILLKYFEKVQLRDAEQESAEKHQELEEDMKVIVREIYESGTVHPPAFDLLKKYNTRDLQELCSYEENLEVLELFFKHNNYEVDILENNGDAIWYNIATNRVFTIRALIKYFEEVQIARASTLEEKSELVERMKDTLNMIIAMEPPSLDVMQELSKYYDPNSMTFAIAFKEQKALTWFLEKHPELNVFDSKYVFQEAFKYVNKEKLDMLLSFIKEVQIGRARNSEEKNKILDELYEIFEEYINDDTHKEVMKVIHKYFPEDLSQDELQNSTQGSAQAHTFTQDYAFTQDELQNSSANTHENDQDHEQDHGTVSLINDLIIDEKTAPILQHQSENLSSGSESSLYEHLKE